MEDNSKVLTREEYRNKKKRKRLRPWAFWLFTFVFLIAIIISFITLYDWEKDNQKIEELLKGEIITRQRICNHYTCQHV